MNLYLDTLVFTANITVPIFLIVFLGILLKRGGVITDEFIQVSSRLVFTVTLPALLFINIVQMDLEQVVDLWQIGFAALATLVSFSSMWLFSKWVVKQPQERGVFVQGCCRSNMGIVGLALCANMYGEGGMAMASLVLASLTPLYNVLSVFYLNLAQRQGQALNTGDMLLEILKNPLILAILLALCFAWFRLPLHPIALKTVNYFSSMTLPLALLGIGGSLSLTAMRDSSVESFVSTLMKLLILPVLITVAAWWAGITGQRLGILFLMIASPTAAASYVMVRAIGGNAQLASNIVLLTTLGSVFSVSLGIYVLKLMGLI